MSHTDATDVVPVGELAEQAEHAIRVLNHRTHHPSTGALADPVDVAEVLAALASTATMLPQLLDQLGRWLEHEQHHGRLRVDDLARLPDTAHTVPALTDNLHDAIHCLRRAAKALDTAHHHATHLAAAEPAINNQNQHTDRWSQNSCRSVGPSHLTKRIMVLIKKYRR